MTPAEEADIMGRLQQALADRDAGRLEGFASEEEFEAALADWQRRHPQQP